MSKRTVHDAQKKLERRLEVHATNEKLATHGRCLHKAHKRSAHWTLSLTKKMLEAQQNKILKAVN